MHHTLTDALLSVSHLMRQIGIQDEQNTASASYKKKLVVNYLFQLFKVKKTSVSQAHMFVCS
jgi:hypothetical protein